MIVRIVEEIQLIIISYVSKMNEINLICKALFCISFIECTHISLSGYSFVINFD